MLGLVYVSSAARLFTASELAALLQVSRRNNAALGITGLLLYIGGNFMQALEGEAEAVDALYRTITEDPRHRSVMSLVRAPLQRRLFPDWAMGFKEADALSPELHAEISSFLDTVRENKPPPKGGHPAQRLLQNFALTMR